MKGYKMTDEMKAAIKFVNLVGIEGVAEFIVNQTKAIEGLTQNNRSFAKEFRKLGAKPDSSLLLCSRVGPEERAGLQDGEDVCTRLAEEILDMLSLKVGLDVNENAVSEIAEFIKANKLKLVGKS